MAQADAEAMSLKRLAGRLRYAAVVVAWVIALQAWPACRVVRAAPSVAAAPGRPPPNFQGTLPSAAVRRVADWVVASGDHDDLPFVIIDKIAAKVYVFDKAGALRGASFALLGAARGDESTPGIGAQPLATIRPDERTTPAGRFVATLGRDLQHDVLWIDYGESLSLHRVVHGNPNDHRLQRLATSSAADKRISYGCVNVPAAFFDDVVLPIFTGTKGIVYILPEVRPMGQIFPGVTSN